MASKENVFATPMSEDEFMAAGGKRIAAPASDEYGILRKFPKELIGAARVKFPNANTGYSTFNPIFLIRVTQGSLTARFIPSNPNPPKIVLIKGLRISFTSELTIAVKAPPMMIPTAI
jgi:hypothetical protein